MRLRDIGWVIASIAALGLLTIAVSLWLGNPTAAQDGWAEDFWLAVAEAGIQVITVGVIGGALAAAWQAIAKRREIAASIKEREDAAEIERRDRIRAELAQLVLLYNDVKAVRRTLRSLGLDVNLHVPDDDLRARQLEKREAREEARQEAQEMLKHRLQEEQMLVRRRVRELEHAQARAGRLARAVQTVTGTREPHQRKEEQREEEEAERRKQEDAERRGWAEQEKRRQKARRRRKRKWKQSKQAGAELRQAMRLELGTTVRLTEDQVRGFHEQMRRLNKLQLDYEAKAREYRQIELLGKETVRVVEELEFLESYLNTLVDLWEERGWTIREGTPLSEVSDLLQDLYRREEFRAGFSHRMNAITEVMNRQLFDLPASA